MSLLGNIGGAFKSLGNFGSNLFGMGNQFGNAAGNISSNIGQYGLAAPGSLYGQGGFSGAGFDNLAAGSGGMGAANAYKSLWDAPKTTTDMSGIGGRSGGTMGGWGDTIQGLAGLGTAYANWQGVQMAGEQNEWLRKFSEGQRDTQLTLTAADQSDRQRTRARSSGVYKSEEQIQAEVDEYMNEHGVA